ncbi:hypothetical protein SDC9_169445 [bioreactor metagenome]|uniref:Uncharacterized protein n=1 Tax=bioreactor metagenome TaxID=1076179 RepID=A0A645G7W8_9ZZZZ
MTSKVKRSVDFSCPGKSNSAVNSNAFGASAGIRNSSGCSNFPPGATAERPDFSNPSAGIFQLQPISASRRVSFSMTSVFRTVSPGRKLWPSSVISPGLPPIQPRNSVNPAWTDLPVVLRRYSPTGLLMCCPRARIRSGTTPGRFRSRRASGLSRLPSPFETQLQQENWSHGRSPEIPHQRRLRKTLSA